MLDRAADAVRSQLRNGGASELQLDVVAKLQRAVLDAVHGHQDDLLVLTGLARFGGPPGEAGAASIIAALRRQLLQHDRDVASLPSWDKVHLVSALSHVETLVASTALHEGSRASAEEDELRAVVEVAHDLRSPLASVLFLLEVLRSGRSGPVNAVQQKQLRMVHSSIFALNQVACDLIDFVRGSERFDQDSASAFSIADLLQSVVDIVQPIADERRIALEILVPRDDARIGRAALISRILLNLAVNAVQYSGDGIVLLGASDGNDETVVFSVRDGGRAIPERVVPHLFNPFRPSGDNRGRVFSSSGLGLAVCHRLVSALGGVLRVESSADHGTRFHFSITLPRA